ncbi:hypothetical protein OsI_35004 [Oryza sativa Indica Group]|uniref:non-specific serine/threonine protein kinase n=1 Tax=Oryza sativa subsp. indica TaxID=39946 RepID=A2ZB60_ORYSI|nr:hypothetical protein OsI_35004 [Oryza sativa Indica Group]
MGQCCTGGGKAVAGDEAEPGTSKAAPPSRGTSSKNGSAKQQPCSPAAKAAATEAAAAASSSKKPAGPIGEVLERPMEEVRTTYSIGKELGRGQFGVTHLCTHKATGEKLACKTIAKRKLANKEDVDDVRREVQIMHHLSGQPNIVDLRGAYEDKHNVHLVMELCAGGELFDRIIARGHYTERAAAALLRAIVGIEFVTATVHMNKMDREEHLYTAFQYFDKDNSGYITKEELEQALKEQGLYDANEIKDVITDADSNNVGLRFMFGLAHCPG